MNDGRWYTDDILVELQPISTPQIVIDCSSIYTSYYGWISEYAALPTTINPPPVFYNKPGWQFFLENLSLNYYANSLPEARAGEIKANSTQNDKLIVNKSLAREFKRFELSLLQRKFSTDSWKVIAIENLYNHGNMFNYANLKAPFLTQGEIDMFGTTTQVGVQFRDTNVSRRIELPTSNDILTLRGCFRIGITM
jgi:hypothetical protein